MIKWNRSALRCSAIQGPHYEDWQSVSLNYFCRPEFIANKHICHRKFLCIWKKSGRRMKVIRSNLLAMKWLDMKTKERPTDPPSQRLQHINRIRACTHARKNYKNSARGDGLCPAASLPHMGYASNAGFISKEKYTLLVRIHRKFYMHIRYADGAYIHVCILYGRLLKKPLQKGSKIYSIVQPLYHRSFLAQCQQKVMSVCQRKHNHIYQSMYIHIMHVWILYV